VQQRLVATSLKFVRDDQETIWIAPDCLLDLVARKTVERCLGHLLTDSHPAMIAESTFEALRTRFERQQGSVLAAVEARSKDRPRLLANAIETRKKREAEEVRQVLDGLDKALRAELAAEEQPEASLF
jgi:hypothetical protein